MNGGSRNSKNKTQVVKKKQLNFPLTIQNLQLYSWVASAGSEKQWVLFTQQKKHFIHSFSRTDGQVIFITTKKNLRTSAASSQYAKAVSLGEELCASFFSFLSFMLAVCKKKTNKKRNGW